MKIRNGFVSNSSSSSFVLITTKENYDKVLNSATPLQKFLVDAARFTSKKVFGKNCLIFSEYDDGDGGFYHELPIDKKLLPKNNYEYDYEKNDDVREAWEAFIAELDKDKNATFSHYEHH